MAKNMNFSSAARLRDGYQEGMSKEQIEEMLQPELEKQWERFEKYFQDNLRAEVAEISERIDNNSQKLDALTEEAVKSKFEIQAIKKKMETNIKHNEQFKKDVDFTVKNIDTQINQEIGDFFKLKMNARGLIQ